MKYAIEFDVIRHENGKLSFVAGNSQIVSELHWLYDSFEFEYDYWDWFSDENNTPELQDVTEFEKEYHVFQYGEVEEETSYNWEYGVTDFDGFTFEPEYTSIHRKML